MSRTVKYLFAALVMSVMLTGCFEGPTGPQGTQGKQGEKGDSGSGTISNLKHLVRSSEVTVVTNEELQVIFPGGPFSSTSCYVVRINNPFFEIDCDYSLWDWNDEIGAMMKIDSYWAPSMLYFNLMVTNGKIAFFSDSDISGHTLLFIKYKP
jgi:hypothetical protein